MRWNRKHLVLGMCVAFVLFSAFAGAGVSVASATTWRVDDDLVQRPDANFTSIQDAVDAANPGDTIIVYPGTYTENVDVNKDHLTIKSEGGAEVTIVQAANPDDHVFEVTADYVNISGFTVKGASSGIYLYSSNNSRIENVNASNNYNGIYLWHSSNNTITNNTASNSNSAGIYLEYSNDNTIFNNIATENWDSGIYLGNSNFNTIKNNNVSNTRSMDWGGGIWLRENGNYNIISHNIISSNGYSGILFDGNINNNTIANNKIQNNRGYGICGIGRNSTIVNNIFINDGISPAGYSLYHHSPTIENNTVNGKPLYFYRNQDSFTVPSDAGSVILVNCTDAAIKGIEATHTDVGVQLAYSSNVSIMNSNLSNNIYGIYLYASSENNIAGNNVSKNSWGIEISRYPNSNNNIICNNTINSNYNWDFMMDGPGYGIGLGGENNTVFSNNISNNDQYGVYLTGDNNTLGNNNLTSNRIYICASGNGIYNNTFLNEGLSIESGSSNIIYGNTFSKGEIHIIGYNSNHNIVFNNTVSDSNYGLYLHHTNNNTIKYNTLTSNNISGIYLFYSVNNNISYNCVANNKKYGFYFYQEGSTNNSITDNNISSNGIQANKSWHYNFYNDQPDNVTAEYNFWGTENATLIAESIYDYYDDSNKGIVDFIPFRTSAPAPPVASFSFSPDNPVVNQAITFDASSSYDPDGYIVSYNWTFGDGTNGTGMIINHSYSSAGNYTVTLTVSDNEGLNSTISANISVSAFTPRAPIRISGNLNFTGENGVIHGSGSEIDPYVIEHWDINVSEPHTWGIYIENTSAYFVIRNCYIHGSPSHTLQTNGIYLSNVTHGVIEGVVCNNSGNGFSLLQSFNNILVNNTLDNGYGGISLIRSDGNTLINNTVSTKYGFATGIGITGSSVLTT